MEPFRKPNGGRFYPEDTFNTAALGYRYDDLMDAPIQQLRQPPSLLTFKNVQISTFERKCYQIHAMIYDKNKLKQTDDEKDIDPIQTIEDMEDHYESPHYAGGVAIFGRGMECDTCKSSPPRDIKIDITECLSKLQISRYDAINKIYILEKTSI